LNPVYNTCRNSRALNRRPLRPRADDGEPDTAAMLHDPRQDGPDKPFQSFAAH